VQYDDNWVMLYLLVAIQNGPVIFPVIGPSVLVQPIRMTQLAKCPSPFSAGSKHCVLVHVVQK